MSDLIIGAINKSIGNKKYHLRNLDELLNILQKENLNTVEKYYLKELFSIPIPILKEKFLKNLNEKEKTLFFQKAKELGFYNENF
jgi:hypothetical protein